LKAKNYDFFEGGKTLVLLYQAAAKIFVVPLHVKQADHQT
jgi:hypothetical protein